jgi:putative DNA methylase
VTGKTVTFDIAVGKSGPPIEGTVGRQGATCIACDTPVPLTYIRAEGQAKRMGQQLMAVVAQGQRQRVYLPATAEHIKAADVPRPDNVPEAELPKQALGFRVQAYGMTTFADLFTNRQLVALTTFSDLVTEARDRIKTDAHAAGLLPSDTAAYATAVATYLAFAVSRISDYLATTTTWASNPQMEILRNTFARQAIAMTWDFAEGNPFADSSGSLSIMLRAIGKVVDAVPAFLLVRLVRLIKPMQPRCITAV